jgi:DNA transformation protein
MKSTSDFAEYAVELLGTVGRVAARRMFGGYGLYCDGVMFALIADDVLYLRADAASRSEFERTGSAPFVYDARGRRVTMAYWRAPDEAMESRELAAPWARAALAAALRARAAKRPARRRRRRE